MLHQNNRHKKELQTTNTILMVRPVRFRRNDQTAMNNYYQKESSLSETEINKRAIQEFDDIVKKLNEVGVEIIIIQDIEDYDTPDSIFPNNWISFHQNGDIGIYPMFAENRRKERRPEILDIVEKKGFEISNIIDYTSAEESGVFLESTGSLVLDRENRKAYCALSPRADEDLFIEFCEDFEYTPVVFTANQNVGKKRLPIYHTNVMMTVAETFVVICLECVDNKKERKNIINHLKNNHKEIIRVTEKQIESFAGNMLQVRGSNEQLYLVMSTAAFHSLTSQQIKQIERHCKTIHSNLSTIEMLGGGSARCMMAEVFLPKRNKLYLEKV